MDPILINHTFENTLTFLWDEEDKLHLIKFLKSLKSS